MRKLTKRGGGEDGSSGGRAPCNVDGAVGGPVSAYHVSLSTHWPALLPSSMPAPTMPPLPLPSTPACRAAGPLPVASASRDVKLACGCAGASKAFIAFDTPLFSLSGCQSRTVASTGCRRERGTSTSTVDRQVAASAAPPLPPPPLLLRSLENVHAALLWLLPRLAESCGAPLAALTKVVVATLSSRPTHAPRLRECGRTQRAAAGRALCA